MIVNVTNAALAQPGCPTSTQRPSGRSAPSRTPTTARRSSRRPERRCARRLADGGAHEFGVRRQGAHRVQGFDLQMLRSRRALPGAKQGRGFRVRTRLGDRARGCDSTCGMVRERRLDSLRRPLHARRAPSTVALGPARSPRSRSRTPVVELPVGSATLRSRAPPPGDVLAPYRRTCGSGRPSDVG